MSIYYQLFQHANNLFSDMKDGPYIFHFANNTTYEAFHYDRRQRNRINTKLCRSPQHVPETYEDRISLAKSNLSKEFQDCMHFITTYKAGTMKRWIKCYLVKKLRCGERTLNHIDSDDVTCNWTWNNTKSEFDITVHNFNNMSTSTTVPYLSSNKFDLLGYLQCTLRDDYGARFYIEEPFVLRQGIDSATKN